MPHPRQDLHAAPAWPAEPCPYGIGEWWVADAADGLLAVIPPGAIGDLDETPDARTRWRTLWWPAGLEHDDPWSEDGAPSRPQAVSVADVLVLVGPAHGERVRGVCERQLAHLRRFAAGPDGRPDEDRAREASRILSRLHRELDDAFALEAWHERDAVQEESAPNTADELLREVDGVEPSRAEIVLEGLQRGYWWAVTAYRDFRRAGTRPQAMLARFRDRPPAEPARTARTSCDTGEHAVVGH